MESILYEEICSVASDLKTTKNTDDMKKCLIKLKTFISQLLEVLG